MPRLSVHLALVPPPPKSLVSGSDNHSLWPFFSQPSTNSWQAEVSSQPRLLSPWGTHTKHSSSSETGIEISLKSMDFKILVVHGWVGVGGAPLLLQRIRGGSSRAVTAQRGTENGQTDAAGLGGGSSGSREGMGHAGWGHLAHEQGQPSLGSLGLSPGGGRARGFHVRSPSPGLWVQTSCRAAPHPYPPRN